MDVLNKYEDCRIVGTAIKQTGDILRPFITQADKDLLWLISSIGPKEREKFYPLSCLIRLFDIAEKNNLLDKLAISWATNVLHSLINLADVQTPEMALRLIEQVFPIQHEGDVGTLKIAPVNSHTAHILDSTYCPCGYISTMVTRIIKSYGAKNIDVVHEENRCRKRGDEECRYTITWSESELLILLKRNTVPPSGAPF